MDPDARTKLKAKLRKKTEERKNGNKVTLENLMGDGGLGGEMDIIKMMENVNRILQTNPQMVQQVSKCVSNVMNNKGLMESLVGQIQDQTLDNNDVSTSADALEK